MMALSWGASSMEIRSAREVAGSNRLANAVVYFSTPGQRGAGGALFELQRGTMKMAMEGVCVRSGGVQAEGWLPCQRTAQRQRQLVRC